MEPKKVHDTWAHGSLYERYVGRWSRQVAPRFLAWVGCGTGALARGGFDWLDVGCGTGALCGAVLDSCAPRQVTGVEPSAGFLRTARQNLGDQAYLCQGTAARIPLAADAVDAAICGLVLNFTPDPLAALGEMARVTRRGGTVAAYVWDYAEKMELMRYFWDAAAALDPAADDLDEGPRFPICRPDAMERAFTTTGLREVETTAVDVPTVFASFEDYWQPFLGGQGPGPAYVATLDETRKTRLRENLRRRLPTQPDGSIHLIARAWAAKGKVM